MSRLDRIFEAAAEARRANVRQTTDRPSQRRCAENPGSPARSVIRSPRMDLRAADDSSGLLHFTGYASVYEAGYEMWDMFGPYTEQVLRGAGAESLQTPDLDVPLVLAHDSLRRMARTLNGSLSLSEDDTGLLSDAPVLDPADADVAYIAPKLRSGLVDEMSFRFVITSGQWSPDWMEYHIQAYDVHRGDVAIVGYGANPWTAGAGLRSALALEDMTEAQLRDVENNLHRERQRRGLAPAPVAAGGMTRDDLERAFRSTALPPATV